MCEGWEGKVDSEEAEYDTFFVMIQTQFYRVREREKKREERLNRIKRITTNKNKSSAISLSLTHTQRNLIRCTCTKETVAQKMCQRQSFPSL